MSSSTNQENSSAWRQWIRANRTVVSVVSHMAIFAVSWVLAFAVAYNLKFGEVNWLTVFCLPLIIPVVVIKTSIFVLSGLHRGWWRYVGLRDVFAISRSVWVGFVLIWILYYGLVYLSDIGVITDPFRGNDFPDSVFLIDFVGTIIMVSGVRIAVRLYHEEVRPSVEGVTPRLLIVGAGNSGENVAREILRMSTLNFNIIGFLDDDPQKHRAMIHGIEVLGPVKDIKYACEENDVDEILIALPSASRDEMRRVVEHCQGTNLKFKTLPAISDLIAGRLQVNQIRDVDINDLLGRDPVTLDVDDIERFIKDRVVMITGAGGSIGSEMCRQIAKFAPRRLVLAEQFEGALFEIDKEIRRDFAEIDVVPYIMDIGDKKRVERVFSLEHPSAVFHAAAHKHVPMMEYNPGEAIKNNIHGTRTIADAAVAASCEKFVMISTDKAVNPTSIMGCSKRVAEMYTQGLNASVKTQFVTVRFGNVLGSSGSVIPIFKEQIRRGGPVTVTHPEMIRYFMTIPEASQLVLQAASMGNGGEIFVLDMGDPVKIVDLARDLITLSGFRPDDDIKIEFSGIRPGEKLYEELAIDGEDVARTPHPKIGIWNIIPVDLRELTPTIDRFVGEADGMSHEQVRDRLKEIVPEFLLETPPPMPKKPMQTVAEVPAQVDPNVASA